uniref:DNA packaging protein UL33-like protein n=1 Tax=Walrus alphaherpesvirus 1 TaxID=2717850 RepID=A0A7G1GZV7_9ALPH|nr:DNA packaging protein UL33-like protein [Walrus alphaherpesvirus 1]
MSSQGIEERNTQVYTIENQSKMIKNIIPNEELDMLSLDELEDVYLKDRTDLNIWFEDILPPEMELFLPTTDSKLNYLSFTQRLASTLKYSKDNNITCDHTAALKTRKERFAAVINRFLDLHQIIRDV